LLESITKPDRHFPQLASLGNVEEEVTKQTKDVASSSTSSELKSPVLHEANQVAIVRGLSSLSTTLAADRKYRFHSSSSLLSLAIDSKPWTFTLSTLHLYLQKHGPRARLSSMVFNGTSKQRILSFPNECEISVPTTPDKTAFRQGNKRQREDRKRCKKSLGIKWLLSPNSCSLRSKNDYFTCKRTSRSRYLFNCRRI